MNKVISSERQTFYTLLEKGEYGDKIVLKSKNPKSDQKLTVSPIKDGRGGYLGLIRSINKASNATVFNIDPLKTKITIENNREFDIRNDVDMSYWKFIKYYVDYIEISEKKANQSKTALFYIDVPIVEAKKSISSKKLRHNAEEYIYADTIKNYVNRIRLIGNVDMSNNAPDEQLNYLLTMAEKYPKKVIAAYENVHSIIQLLFYKGIDTNTINKINGIYKYNDHLLGNDEMQSIVFLQDKKNKDILEMLKKDVDNKLGNDMFQKNQVFVTEKKAPKKETKTSK